MSAGISEQRNSVPVANSFSATNKTFWQRGLQDTRLRRFLRPAALGLLDAFCAALSGYLAFGLRLGQVPIEPKWMSLYIATLLPLIAFRLIGLAVFGVYRIAARHVGLRDALRIALATFMGSGLFAGYIAVARVDTFPRSLIFISWLLDFLLIMTSRAVYREMMVARGGAKEGTQSVRQWRVLVVGAGVDGASIAREVRRRASDGFRLIGFLDDDPMKRKMLVDGAPVLGTTSDIRRIVAEKSIDSIIISIKRPSNKLLQEITRSCEGLKVRIQIASGFSDMKHTPHLHALRELAVEDLLGRGVTRVNNAEIASYLYGERVLVTGAGGSIGSELVRQIVATHPAELFLLGHGENSVFEIEQELKRTIGFCPTCLIADVRDAERLSILFARHRPTVVFHAAAHKHVTLMENNPEEAVTNNVLGTSNLIRVASEHGVRRFVMISTDKAVNPTSVMGASKRIAEMVVQAESRRTHMEVAVVRFGNVLNSRGSVVPVMQKQISGGGPVTVTHPDVMRYFMSIPEAVHLVLQAGALGGRGTIYMLDMGEPVRILDLARELIRLSGFVPDKDIPIQFIGLRPGEKLFEELLTAEEGATVTRNERIYVAAPSKFPLSEFEQNVNTLIAAAQQGNRGETLRQISLLVPNFTLPDALAVVAA